MKINQNDNRHYTVYCHRNKINNKSYIGQTGMVPYTKRWTGHGTSGSPYDGCTLFQRAILKYGWDNFEHFVIKDNLTLEEANYYETLFIFLFDTINPKYSYNLAQGGGNHKHTEDTKRKISEHHADFSKEKHPMWGKHHSEETKKKIRQAALNRKLSEETKKKISEKAKGKNNPRAKSVLCIETGQIFDTAKEASIWAKRDNSLICKCCNGKVKSCGVHPETGKPLHWKYIEI